MHPTATHTAGPTRPVGQHTRAMVPVPVAAVCGRGRCMYSAWRARGRLGSRLCRYVWMLVPTNTKAAAHRQQVLCCLLDPLHDCQAHDVVYKRSLGALHLQVPQGGEHQAACGTGPHIAAPPCTRGGEWHRSVQVGRGNKFARGFRRDTQRCWSNSTHTFALCLLVSHQHRPVWRHAAVQAHELLR